MDLFVCFCANTTHMETAPPWHSGDLVYLHIGHIGSVTYMLAECPVIIHRTWQDRQSHEELSQDIFHLSSYLTGGGHEEVSHLPP